VRPHDYLYEGLCGAAAGAATLYLQREFHGLSTTIAEHAQAAEREVNRSAEPITLPMTTLKALCEQHAPANFEFLKVDVEGAEADVLRGADFSHFRPKMIVVEAIKPLTLAPAWDEWEPLLSRHGYAYVWDDELNRYYVAEEARALAPRLTQGPKWYADGPQIGNFKGAAEDAAHPDHHLARLLSGADLARLPLMDPSDLLALLTADSPDPGRTASATDLAAITRRLFGSAAAQHLIAPQRESIRETYRRIIDSDAFRAACGRIAASYAW
jgi:Methyltransferase FkbM domain